MSSLPAPFRDLTSLRADMLSRLKDAIRGSVMIASEDDGLALTFGIDQDELTSASLIADQSGGPRPQGCMDANDLISRTLDWCGSRAEAAIMLRFTIPTRQDPNPTLDESLPTGGMSTLMCGYRLTADRAVRMRGETVRAAHLTDPQTGGQLPDEPGLIYP